MLWEHRHDCDVFLKIIKGGRVEKDIALGSLGHLDLSFSGGKAQLSVTIGYGPAGASASLMVTEDATGLVNLIFEAIEKASPPNAVPIEETVKQLILAAVSAIK